MWDAIHKLLYRDQSAQAMVEAAIVMPIVVLVFLAAHEFMYAGEYKFRVRQASRYVTWEAAMQHNHPPLTDPKQWHGWKDGNKEVTQTLAQEAVHTAELYATGVWFEGQQGVYQTGSGIVGDGQGYGESFTFSEIGNAGTVGSSVSTPADGLGMAVDFIGQLAGMVITGTHLGPIPVGADLPSRGFVATHYWLSWEPAFMAILTPALPNDTVTGGSGTVMWQSTNQRERGTTRYALYGSGEGQARYEAETAAESGRAGLVVLGSSNPGSTNVEERAYGRYCLLTHNWRALDRFCMQYHVKGFTFLGSISLPYQSGEIRSRGIQSTYNSMLNSGSPPSVNSDQVGFSDALGAFADFYPFAAMVRQDRVGSPKEKAKHITQDYPAFSQSMFPSFMK